MKNNVRLKATCAMVEKGVPVSTAMIKAGYSVKSARGPGYRTTTEAIVKAQEKYLAEYVRGAKKVKFTGHFAVQRLMKAAEGKDDFNAIQAIKVHHNTMLKTLEKINPISMHGVFIIPASGDTQNWVGNARKVAASIEAERIKFEDEAASEPQVEAVPVESSTVNVQAAT